MATLADLIQQLTAALAAAQALADAGSGDAATIQGQFDAFKALELAYEQAPNDADSTQLQAIHDFLAALPTPTATAAVKRVAHR